MDSGNKATGQKIIQEMGKEALLACIQPEDIVRQYNKLMDIADNGDNREAINAIQTIWSYVLPKPKQVTENINKNFNQELTEDDLRDLETIREEYRKSKGNS